VHGITRSEVPQENESSKSRETQGSPPSERRADVGVRICRFEYILDVHDLQGEENIDS